MCKAITPTGTALCASSRSIVQCIGSVPRRVKGGHSASQGERSLSGRFESKFSPVRDVNRLPSPCKRRHKKHLVDLEGLERKPRNVIPLFRWVWQARSCPRLLPNPLELNPTRGAFETTAVNRT
jgi:hypothetical protein